MQTETVVAIGKDTIKTLMLMGGPMLIAGAVIGVTVSMLQTVTQLKDQSLTFIPKIIGVLLVTIVATPFLIKTIVEFSLRIFKLAEQLGHV
jgi:flagellar biosynthetic protein FliQ